MPGNFTAQAMTNHLALGGLQAARGAAMALPIACR